MLFGWKLIGGALFAWYSLFCSANPLPEDHLGIEGVRLQFPVFVREVTTLMGQHDAEKYFQHWTQRDFDYFMQQFWHQIENDYSPTGRVGSADFLVDKYESQIFGLFGEMFGVAYLRNLQRSWKLAQTLFEADYMRLNPDSYSNPDGILYQIKDNKIYIAAIMESKVGDRARYSPNQVNGSLAYWKENGIQVPDGSANAKKYFPPDKIGIGHIGTHIPVIAATAAHMEIITHLISTQPRTQFTGQVVTPPFSAVRGRRAVAAFLASLTVGRKIHAEKWVYHHPRTIPLPEGIELDQELNDWIADTGEWPMGSKPGPAGALERHLRRRVMFYGNQMTVFAEVLNERARQVLFRNKRLPAAAPFVRYFFNVREITTDTLIVLRYFIQEYRNHLTDAEVLTDLAKSNRLWRSVVPTQIPSFCGVNLTLGEAI